jgi:capsular exopolysaccharide synthesis family protein
MLVLTSGSVPPNPAELLNTATMERVIEELRERSSVVIFDASPCLPVTDPQVLGTKLDGMLLVVEMGEARKADLRRSKQLLAQAQIRVLGVVFNKVTGEGGGYSSRYPYYGEAGLGNGCSGRNGHRKEQREVSRDASSDR